VTLKHAQLAGHLAFTKSSGDSFGHFAKAQALFLAAMRRVQEEADARQAMWELEQLDDHALRDIGVSRRDIEAHVRGHRK
jgi:uncharacterized protein YjiS (DUF1127 family)